MRNDDIFRAASGLGAVMGSKNLKAMAVRGNSKIQVADGERLSNLRHLVRKLKFKRMDWPTLLPQEKIKKQICFGCIDGCLRQTYSTSTGQTGKYMCQSALFYEVRAQRYCGKVTDVSYHANKMCDDYGLDVATGLQTRETLGGLDLADVAGTMEREGLLA